MIRFLQFGFIITVLLSFNSCSKMTGNIKISYTKAIAQYGNLDSIRQLPLLQSAHKVENPVGFYVGKDFVLVGERSKGIHIFNNVNMQNPENNSFIQIPFNKEFYVEGNYLYAESGYDMLKINISNVYQPVLESRIINAFHEPLYNDKKQALLGFVYINATDEFAVGSAEESEIKSQGKIHIDYSGKVIPLSSVPTMFTGNNGNSKGTINRIATSNNRVYAIGNSKMFIFNNTGIFNMAGAVKTADGSETIYADNGRLYLGSESAVTIYSLSDPNNPKEEGKVEHVTACDPVLAASEVAYSTIRSVSNEGCSSSENKLLVIDVSKVRNSTEIANFDIKSPYGMALINNFLFVGQGKNGLSIFNAKNRKSLSLKKENSAIEAYDIMAHPTENNIIIVANKNGIREYKIDWNNLSLTQIGQLYYK